MNLIGLTGGIGMGKSVAADLLQKRGWSVIDTDVLARQVVEPGQPGLEEIRQLFGPRVIDANDRLVREEVARLIFPDATLRSKLEAILHPRIRNAWLAQVAAWRSEGRQKCVVVVPLLFETKGESHFNRTICLACSAATQRQRLQARGLNDAQIQQRLQSQWPIGRKMIQADFVVWTEAGLEVLEAQLDRILRRLETKS